MAAEVNIATLSASLTFDIAELKRAVAEVAQSQKRISDSLAGIGESAKQAEEKLAGLSESFGALQSAGKLLLRALPFAAIASAAINAAEEIDNALDSIIQRTGKTGAALTDLERSFRTVFKDTPGSAREVAQAMSEVAVRTGFTGESLEELTRVMLAMHKVAGTDLSSSIGTVGKLLTNFGISASEAEGKLDFLYKTTQATGIGMGELLSALQRFGPIMRQLGFSFEQSAAFIGATEKAGLQFSFVLRGLQQAMAEFARRGVKDVGGAFRELIGQIKEAETAEAALATATKFFGRRVGTELAEAIRSGRLEVEQLISVIGDSPRTIRGTEKETRSLADAIEDLRKQVSLAIEPLGKDLVTAIERTTPKIAALVEGGGKLATTFRALPTPLQDTVGGIYALGAALGLDNFAAMATIISGTSDLSKGLYYLAFTAIPGAVKALKSLWLVFLSPQALAVAAVAATIAGLAEAIRQLDLAAKDGAGWAEPILQAAEMSPIFGPLVTGIRNLNSVFRDTFAAGAEGAKGLEEYARAAQKTALDPRFGIFGPADDIAATTGKPGTTPPKPSTGRTPIPDERAAQALKQYKETLKDIADQLRVAELQERLFGESFNLASVQMEAQSAKLAALAKTTSTVTPEMEKLGREIDELRVKSLGEDLQAELAMIGRQAAALGPSFDGAGARAEVLQTALQRLSAEGPGTEAAVVAVVESLTKTEIVSGNAADALKVLAAAYDTARNAAKAAQQDTEDFNLSIQRMDEDAALASATSQQKRAAAAQREIDDFERGIRRAVDANGQRIYSEEEVTRRVGEYSRARTTLYEAEERASSNAFSAVGQAFEDMIAGIALGTQELSFDGITDALKSALANSIKEKLKFDELFKGNIFDLVGSIADTILGGGGLTDIFATAFDAILGNKGGTLDRGLGGGGLLDRVLGAVSGGGSLLNLLNTVGATSTVAGNISIPASAIASLSESQLAQLGEAGAISTIEGTIELPASAVADQLNTTASTLSTLGNTVQGLIGAFGLATGLMVLFGKNQSALNRAIGGVSAVAGASSLSGALGGPTIGSLAAPYLASLATSLGIGGGAAAASTSTAATAATNAATLNPATALYTLGGSIAWSIIMKQLRDSGSLERQGAEGITARGVESLLAPRGFQGLLSVIGGTSPSKAFKQSGGIRGIAETLDPLTGTIIRSFENQLSKGQMSRRFIGGELKGLESLQDFFPGANDRVDFFNPMEKFPELAAEAGAAATAFSTTLAAAMQTGVKNGEEIRFIFNALIDQFGEAGTTGEEATIRIAAAMKELGLDATSAGQLLQDAFAKGKLSADQFNAAMAGLADVTAVSTEQMVSTLSAALDEEAAGIFARLVQTGVDSFAAVTAASDENFIAITGGMQSEFLPRALTIFATLEAMGIRSAEAIRMAFEQAFAFSMPGMAGSEGFFVGESGRLVFGSFDASGKFTPGAAPPLTPEEQRRARQGAGPPLPGYAEGGFVPGLPGEPQLAIVHGGEEIIPYGEAGGGTGIEELQLLRDQNRLLRTNVAYLAELTRASTSPGFGARSVRATEENRMRVTGKRR